MRNFYNKWAIFIRRKIIIQMKRKQRDPRYVARATMIGAGSSFIPFPVQMPFVFAIWFVARKLKWRFSLVLGLAWTFLSNTFTNIPIMYAEYVLGNWMRGRSDTTSYKAIGEKFSESMISGMKDIVTEYGISIVVGSVPLILSFAIMGYLFGYFVSWKHQKKLQAKVS